MTTPKNLYDSLMLDVWPRMGAVVDFGLTKENYRAYQIAVRSGAVSLDDLSAACGNGKKLTTLIGATVETPYDSMGPD